MTAIALTEPMESHQPGGGAVSARLRPLLWGLGAGLVIAGGSRWLLVGLGLPPGIRRQVLAAEAAGALLLALAALLVAGAVGPGPRARYRAVGATPGWLWGSLAMAITVYGAWLVGE